MPRQVRKKSESGIYHIMLCGINKQVIFEDEEDNLKFLETLKNHKAKHDRTVSLCFIFTSLLILLITIFAGCDSSITRPFNPTDFPGVWVSEEPNIQFTFDASSELSGNGSISIGIDNIPILISFGRGNYLFIIDENKYIDDKSSNENVILDGTIKIKDNKLILKVLHNKIFDKEYKTITFIQDN